MEGGVLENLLMHVNKYFEWENLSKDEIDSQDESDMGAGDLNTLDATT